MSRQSVDVFLGQPHNGVIKPESLDAAMRDKGTERLEGFTTMYFRPKPNALHCNGFNVCVAEARAHNARYFAMLHADVVPSPGWLKQLLDDMEEYNLDVLHAPVAIKVASGITSTALGYSMNRWQNKRRITVRELARLPEVFTIEDCQREIDSDAKVLLVNTGCLFMRVNDWFHQWKGFTCWDRIKVENGEQLVDVVPEDWLMSYEATEAGLRVGGTTRVQTRHYGGGMSPVDGTLYGEEADEQFFRINERNASRMVAQ